MKSISTKCNCNSPELPQDVINQRQLECTGEDEKGIRIQRQCAFYSEATKNNADAGKKICRICNLPVEEIKKDKNQECPMEYWTL